MGLRDERRRFFEMRSSCKVVVRNHAFKDHSERSFTHQEILNLVRNGQGAFQNNNSTQAMAGSFLFCPSDEQERKCKLVILMEEVAIEGADPQKGIIVCSAYREVNNEI